MGGPGSGRRKQIDLDAEEKARSQATGEVTSTTAVRLVKVTTPGGDTVEVLGKDEERAYKRARANYEKEFSFTSPADKEDLGALLFLETLARRYQSRLSSGKDYDGYDLTPSEQEQSRRNLNDTMKMIADAKDRLGMSRAKRMAAQSSVAEYLETLRRRAKAFGQLRDDQHNMAISLFKEQQSVVRTFRRSEGSAKERKVLGFETAEDVLKWLEEELFPRFDALDAKFRSEGAYGEEPQSQWAGHPEKEVGR